MLPYRQIEDSSGNKKFDTRVHFKNAKGVMDKKAPYTLVISGGMQVFTDVTSGIKYDAAGTPLPMDQQPDPIREKYGPKPAAPAKTAQTAGLKTDQKLPPKAEAKSHDGDSAQAAGG